MVKPKLKEGYTEWEVIINPNLKYLRTENMDKGVKRYWGIDSNTNRQKLMMIQYPKSIFSRSDMKRIIPKYKTCPNCIIGKKLINTKNNNKNMALNINLPQAEEFSIINTLGRIPKVGSAITRNRVLSEKIVMQGLATISRYPLAWITTDLGKRVVSFLIGLVGIPVVYKLVKSSDMKSEWLEYFTNMLTHSIEMDAIKQGSGFGVEEDIARLIQSVRAGNFAGVGDALIKNQAEIKAQIQRVIPQMSMNVPSLNNFSASIAQFGNNIQSFFENTFRVGRMRLTETTIPKDSIHLGGSKGHKFNIKEASDYRYVGTEDRFRDISNFSKGFKSSRRLTESSDAIYR